MLRRAGPWGAAFLAAACAGSPDPGAAPRRPADEPPRWIWIRPQATDGESARFRREVELEGGIARATLRGAGDDALEAWINGELVASSSDWSRPFEVEVTGALREGTNALAAWCRNSSGPAALWLELEIARPGGRWQRAVTDGSWLTSEVEGDGAPGPAGREVPPPDWREAGFDDAGWRAAVELGPVGAAPWGPPQVFTDGRPEQALAATSLELPAGFTAELVYSVPRARQGSWVSLAFDDRGRLYACDQFGALYRLTPRASGAPPRVEEVPARIASAHGLAWAFGSLYAVVSEEGPLQTGLWRLRDTDGDDRLDSSELLKALEGSGEHGPHAVLPGPDGRSLYVLGGNHTALPEPVVRSRVTPVWGEDQLLESRPDPNGHAVGVLAPGGWICRTDPEGGAWELVAAGMRNAYDAAFDAEGELFTFDSDMEWDVGLPWYRPPRVLHLSSGADFGWRNGSGKWPVSWPDTLPAVAGVGLASPTGVAFGFGTGFPERWRRALFAADWAYGTIYAVHLEPRGASFTGTVEPFVRGEPLPVTDLAVGPDGALWFATGGRGTQSGLYRVRWTGGGDEQPSAASVVPGRASGGARGPAQDDSTAGADDPAVDARALAARELRRMLEHWHGRQDPRAVAEAWPLLDVSDRFLRHAARTAIEHQPLEEWLERALAEERPRAAIEAMLALVRVGPAKLQPRVLERLDSLPLERLGEEERTALARVYGLCFTRMGRPEPERAGPIAARIGSLFPTGVDAVDRELCRLLVYLEAPGIAGKALERMEAASTQEEAIHYAFVLRTLANGWTLEQRRRYFAWLRESAPRFEGGLSLALYVEGIREDAAAGLGERERAELGELVEPLVAEVDGAEGGMARRVEELALEIEGREPHRWTVAELTPEPEELAVGRSLELGRALFEVARCLECHRFGGEGGSTGPDLTGSAGRFGPRDLLEAIVEPSAVVSDQYRDTEFWLESGGLVVGRLERLEPGLIVVRTTADVSVELDEGEVVERRVHPLSRMPEGLVGGLRREEVLDLVAFVLQGEE